MSTSDPAKRNLWSRYAPSGGGETFFSTQPSNLIWREIATEARSERRLEELKLILKPFWFFFVALCRVLQEGENELTALDCYWLGLIDEIIGNPELPNLRQIVEYAPGS